MSTSAPSTRVVRALQHREGPERAHARRQQHRRCERDCYGQAACKCTFRMRNEMRREWRCLHLSEATTVLNNNTRIAPCCSVLLHYVGCARMKIQNEAMLWILNGSGPIGVVYRIFAMASLLCDVVGVPAIVTEPCLTIVLRW
jgi:hypothetical protein